MKRKCKNCDGFLDFNNAGLCKKLYGRDTENLICYECISKSENVSRERIDELVLYYQKQGCMLFSPLKTES